MLVLLLWTVYQLRIIRRQTAPKVAKKEAFASRAPLRPAAWAPPNNVSIVPGITPYPMQNAPPSQNQQSNFVMLNKPPVTVVSAAMPYGNYDSMPTTNESSGGDMMNFSTNGRGWTGAAMRRSPPPGMNPDDIYRD